MVEPKARTMNGNHPSAWLVIAVLSFLCACSPSQPSGGRAIPTREFSQEDKRAALALSISNSEAVADAATPYDRSLLCKNGIEALIQRFQGLRGPSTDQQLQAMEQASAYFSEQVHSIAKLEGKSEAELTRDLKVTREQHEDPAENVQIIAACLRALEPSS